MGKELLNRVPDYRLARRRKGCGRMAINMIITCGCGFKTTSLEEAEKHAKEKKHILRIQGTVTP